MDLVAKAERRSRRRLKKQDVALAPREKKINLDQRAYARTLNKPIKDNPLLVLNDKDLIERLSISVSEDGDIIKKSPGLTKNLADPGKLTSGAVAASLGAIGDQFAADATPTSEIKTSDAPFSPAPDPNVVDPKAVYANPELVSPTPEIGIADATGEIPLGDFPRDKILGSTNLAKAVDYVKGIPGTETGVSSFTPFKANFGDAPITYGDVGKAGVVAYGEMEKKKQFDMAKKSGAWVSISEELIKEVKKETGEEMKNQHQGFDNLRKYFEENDKIGKYIFNKFREVLKKSWDFIIYTGNYKRKMLDHI